MNARWTRRPYEEMQPAPHGTAGVRDGRPGRFQNHVAKQTEPQELLAAVAALAGHRAPLACRRAAFGLEIVPVHPVTGWTGTRKLATRR